MTREIVSFKQSSKKLCQSKNYFNQILVIIKNWEILESMLTLLGNKKAILAVK